MKKSLKTAGKTLLLGIIFLMSLPTAGFCQDVKLTRDEIRQYQNRLDQVKTGNTTRYATEVSQITSWIDEALILIGKDEGEKAKTLALKIGVYMDYVEASMARDIALGQAMEAESQLKALKAEYGKLDAQVQQLAAEEEILQNKLNSLKK